MVHEKVIRLGYDGDPDFLLFLDYPGSFTMKTWDVNWTLCSVSLQCT